MTFEAIYAGDMKAREKKLADEYADACKSWAAAKKEASGASVEAPPKQPILKVWERVRGRAVAENLVSVLKAKWEAKQGETGTGKPATDKKVEAARPKQG